MRILFVVRTIGYGGASKQLAITANAMAQRGHSVAVFSYNFDKSLQVLNKDVLYIPSSHITNNKLKEYVEAPFNIRKTVKEYKPDIVVSWRANAGCLCKLACIGLEVKTIFSERTDPYMETSFILKLATKIADLSNGGVFQTKMAQEYYKRLSTKSIALGNPVVLSGPVEDIVPIEQRQKEIAFVGRFVIKQKRHDIMLKAWQIIRKRFPDYVLSFYGDGVDLDKVKTLCQTLGLNDSVIFHGAVTNVVQRLRNVRVLALSSDYEGIPNVIIEAFEAGTPVVATDCSPGGARVLIDDGTNGFIVPFRDYQQLANKCIDVILDDKLSLMFAQNARKKLKEFDSKVIFDKWEKYLLSINNSDK